MSMGFITGVRAVRPGAEDARRCEITKVENGWIVVVYNEQEEADASARLAETLKAMAEVVPMINKIGGKAAARAAEEELEPWKVDEEEEDSENSDSESDEEKMDKVKGVIESAFAPVDRKKPVETHVFVDLKTMMDFVTKFVA